MTNIPNEHLFKAVTAAALLFGLLTLMTMIGEASGAALYHYGVVL